MNNNLNPTVKNTTTISIGDRLKFQAGGWWALAFGSFFFLLCFIYAMTKIILNYNIDCYKLSPCEKCGYVKKIQPITQPNTKNIKTVRK